MSNGKKNFAERDETLIANYIQRFGNAASVGLLHPSCKIFNHASIDGIIGYRTERNSAVVIGDPVCASDDRIRLARIFHDFCKEQKKKDIYAMTTESFANEVLDCFGGSAIQFGHDIIIDPTIDTRTLTGRYPHHLRQKHTHAVSHGVSVCEYEGNNPEIEEILVTIAHTWLSNRKGVQAYFLPLDVFARRSSKRWFYAQKDSHIIGFMMLSRLDAYHGWVLNSSIMLTPEAPNSTSEFLMLRVLETLRNEGYTSLSIGPTMSPEIGRVEGLGWFSRMVIMYGIKSVRKILNMNDRQRFWNKFQPRKEPSFLTLTSPRMSLQEFRAILRAFNVHVKKN